MKKITALAIAKEIMKRKEELSPEKVIRICTIEERYSGPIKGVEKFQIDIIDEEQEIKERESYCNNYWDRYYVIDVYKRWNHLKQRYDHNQVGLAKEIYYMAWG